jgi:hypothetical protein
MASGSIQPRQVSPDAWQSWIKQGFELVSRKWLAWIAVMTTCCLVTGAAGVAEPIGEYLTLAIGFNLAVTVDRESGWAGMASRFGALFRDAVKFGFQAGMFVLLVSIPLDTAIGLSEMAIEAQAMAGSNGAAGGAILAMAMNDAPLLAHFYEESANNLIAWAMLLPVGLGFLYPLRGFGIGFHIALAHGRHAAILNRRSVLLIALCSFASVLGLIALRLYPLIPVAQGFWMAVNYAMFRDIFLGIAQNRPIRAKAASRFKLSGVVAILRFRVSKTGTASV